MQPTYCVTLDSEEAHQALAHFAAKKLQVPAGDYESTMERVGEDVKVTLVRKAEQKA